MNSDIMSARQQIILRVLRGLVAFAFVLFGTLKLIGIPMMVDVFDHVGLGLWFRYATGVSRAVSMNTELSSWRTRSKK